MRRCAPSGTCRVGYNLGARTIFWPVVGLVSLQRTHHVPAQSLRVIVPIVAKPDRVEQMRQLLVSLVAPSSAEDACLRYELLHNLEDPTDFAVIEEWQSATHYEGHLSSPHVKSAFPSTRWTLGQALGNSALPTFNRITCRFIGRSQTGTRAERSMGGRFAWMRVWAGGRGGRHSLRPIWWLRGEARDTHRPQTDVWQSNGRVLNNTPMRHNLRATAWRETSPVVTTMPADAPV